MKWMKRSLTSTLRPQTRFSLRFAFVKGFKGGLEACFFTPLQHGVCDVKVKAGWQRSSLRQTADSDVSRMTSSVADSIAEGAASNTPSQGYTTVTRDVR